MDLCAKEAWQELEQQSELKTKIAQDNWRLYFHLMPETGWMNDPNGLCQFNGVYHFYHQYVPQNPAGKEAPHWGHKTSTNLVDFKEEAIFLSPEHSYDRNGVFSGSAIVKDDQIHFFYTGNVKNEGDHDYTFSGREQNTVHVISDGYSIEKQEVVIPHEAYPAGFTDHIRDPKVFEKEGRYYMILGARTRESEGKILIYQSEDLSQWTYQGIFLGDDYSLGYMWECPDFFQLDGQDILLFSPQGVDPQAYAFNNLYQSGYLLGEVDWKNLKFKPTADFVELDRGFDFYAPQTFLDQKGRRLLWGWMGLGDTSPEYSNPTVTRGWQHAATLPRELSFNGQRLIQQPLPEYQKLRGKSVFWNVELKDSFTAPELAGEVYELQVELTQQTKKLQLLLRQDTILSYDGQIFTLSHGPSGYGRKKRSIQLSELRQIQLFMDTSSIEVFINNGEYTFTSRLYPQKEQDQIVFSGTGSLAIQLWPFSN